MPISVEHKYSAELGRKRAIGISLPFSEYSVFNSTYQTLDTYKSDLLLYFLTAKGERPMNPEFGNSYLNKLLFENSFTSAEKKVIENQIKQDIALYFPKLVIDEISFETQPDYNSLQLYLKFHIKDSLLEDELTINLG